MYSNPERVHPEKRFSEITIAGMLQSKPANLQTYAVACAALRDLRDFKSYVTACNKTVKKGWQYISNRGGLLQYGMSAAKIVKLNLLIESVAERARILEAEEQKEAARKKRTMEARKQFAAAGIDKELASALWDALDNSPPTNGYIYLKCWSLPDGTSWFKIGVTNNPSRREIEQNVLPVAAETIACVDVGSMDRARAIESIAHKVLSERRIKDAANRELFHLSISQAAAVKAVFMKLGP